MLHSLIHLLFDYKTFMGWLAIAIMLIAYSGQLWKIWTGIPKSHPVAWFGFGFLTGVGYLVQRQEGGGSGSWVMGLTAIFCFIISFSSFYRRGGTLRDFDRWDWTAFIFGTITFAVYLASKKLSWGPVTSAVLAAAADVILYWPIWKDSWREPEKEYVPGYALNSAKFVPSIFGMQSYSIATLIYPSALIIVNALTAYYLRWRKNVIAREKWEQLGEEYASSASH